MKRLLLIMFGLLCTWGLFSTVIADPVVGQNVIYRYDSSHEYDAVVSKVISSTEANIVIFTHGDTAWWNTTPASITTMYLNSVTHESPGNLDNRWRENPNVDLVGPAGATGATGASSSVAGISTPTLVLNGSSVQFSTTNETLYTVAVSISGAVTLTGGFDGVVSLLCDATATPSTVVAVAGNSSTGTVVVGVALTTGSVYMMSWRVPVSHRCRLTTTNNTGTPSYGINTQRLQALSL